MHYCFAPMEGITGYLYRNVYNQFFGSRGPERYFAPFITPTRTTNFKSRELNDLTLEHNPNIHLIPQVLTNRAEDFLYFTEKLYEMGYQEVNLNLGCPSRTVVSKGRGSGFLADPLALERFFEEVFAHTVVKISVKTRIGKDSPEEFPDLIDLYNRYPISELIVHPRIQLDYYNNHADWDAFQLAVDRCVHPLCYNGDLFTAADVERFQNRFPSVDRIMLGRGAIANPALFRQLRCGKGLTKPELRQFHEAVKARYSEVFYGERPVLCKLKELWNYMICMFEGTEPILKRMRKAQHLSDFETAVSDLFRDCALNPNAGFQPKKGGT